MFINDQGKDYKGRVGKKPIRSYTYTLSVDYVIGFFEGMWLYAYMKEGVYYVGSTGKTFKQAKIDFIKNNWAAFPKGTKEWLKTNYLPSVTDAGVL